MTLRADLVFEPFLSLDGLSTQSCLTKGNLRGGSPPPYTTFWIPLSFSLHVTKCSSEFSVIFHRPALLRIGARDEGGRGGDGSPLGLQGAARFNATGSDASR